MNTITFENILNNIISYNEEDIELIKKAYSYANEYHNGQKRESGEDYITHPLNVAYILSTIHADKDTICAGLLHDIVEDTNITIKDI